MTRPHDLATVIAGCRHLLLDFDGPVCQVYAGIPAPVIAARFRDTLRTAGISLPATTEPLGDPLEVFRIVADLGDEIAERAQRELTSLEVQAVATAAPTPGAAELITTARQTGRTVSIVSNNSSRAIRAYLDRQDLTGDIGLIVARNESDPRLMKPSPYMVRAAVGILDAENHECAFIGDSDTDVIAALLAGVPVIGYANRPAKAEALTHARAAAVTTDLAEITTAIRQTPSHALPN
ncbi:MAG: HAD family hydrolase [Streptosporangiaceae bacterium]